MIGGAVRVVVTDEATGEVLEDRVVRDYFVVCAPSTRIVSTTDYPTGSTVVALKRRVR